VKSEGKARDYVLERGGHLWIWAKPFEARGQRCWRDTSWPADGEFTGEYVTKGITVHTAAELKMYGDPGAASIARRWWPRSGLSISNRNRLG
jgi:hypothetical protein